MTTDAMAPKLSQTAPRQLSQDRNLIDQTGDQGTEQLSVDLHLTVHEVHQTQKVTLQLKLLVIAEFADWLSQTPLMCRANSSGLANVRPGKLALFLIRPISQRSIRPASTLQRFVDDESLNVCAYRL